MLLVFYDGEQLHSVLAHYQRHRVQQLVRLRLAGLLGEYLKHLEPVHRNLSQTLLNSCCKCGRVKLVKLRNLEWLILFFLRYRSESEVVRWQRAIFRNRVRDYLR